MARRKKQKQKMLFRVEKAGKKKRKRGKRFTDDELIKKYEDVACDQIPEKILDRLNKIIARRQAIRKSLWTPREEYNRRTDLNLCDNVRSLIKIDGIYHDVIDYGESYDDLEDTTDIDD